jgi:hypothetical protein
MQRSASSCSARFLFTLSFEGHAVFFFPGLAGGPNK